MSFPLPLALASPSRTGDRTLSTSIAGERVVLHAARALAWPREKTLFVADVHLGKGAAFRAGGIPLPRGTTATDLRRLDALIDES
ncbi:MAG TPA: DEAD/DEAH box helicase, partial [Casimicrobiaceae bacterium]|nr:DEAD/DEAH box helicase [Casimicrobiaceae bacterium]